MDTRVYTALISALKHLFKRFIAINELQPVDKEI
jgi:hypothetical protein